MAKKIKTIVKLQAPAGEASPAKGIGPALGPHGVSAAEFCKMFNEQTKGQDGIILPVVITIYQDRTFSFIVKTPSLLTATILFGSTLYGNFTDFLKVPKALSFLI